MRIKYSIPTTRDQGQCEIVGQSSPMETAKENALWTYNSMREHDGQRPVSAFPSGTTSKRISNKGEEQ